MPIRKNMLRTGMTAMLFISLLPRPVRADDPDSNTPAAVDETHPIYPTDTRWVPGLLLGVGGIFAAALAAGVYTQSRQAKDQPSTSDDLNR